MRQNRDAYGALFSAMVPGLGQLAQGRTLKGLLFVTWTALSLLGVFRAAQSGGFPGFIGAELLVVSIWATIDAYRFTRP